MSKIKATARLKIHPGKGEEFKRLSEICMQLVREKDPGTLRFEIYVNDDETEAVVIEEYANEEAFSQHMENMGGNIAATFAIVDMQGEILGHPSPEMRAAVEAHGLKVYAPFLGLSE